MFAILVRWLKGYLFIRVTGRDCNRFLNICSKNAIDIWEINSNEEEVTLCISKKYYKKILEYGKKLNVDIYVNNKKGLPFFFYRYKKRKCFAIGFVLCLMMLYGFTFFIWDINVTGTNVYTEEQIISDIANNYVHIGTPRQEINCTALEKELREKYEKVAWISCDVVGTSLNVVLTETVEPDLIKKSDLPCNIVASKDGVITDMIVRSGKKISDIGEEVKKGDILITGAVNIYNEYDELIETEYIPADGDIYAISEYEYDDEFPLEYYDKAYTGNKKTYFSVMLFGKVYTPYHAEFKDSSSDYITGDYNLRLGNAYYMPIGIKKTVVREYMPEKMKYNESEATQKARARLDVYMEELRKKGVEILENNVTIKVGEELCEAKGKIVAKELIGVPSDITIFEQGEETK